MNIFKPSLNIYFLLVVCKLCGISPTIRSCDIKHQGYKLKFNLKNSHF